MTGSNAHDHAYLEVGEHGFTLFPGPDAAAPVLDIDGTLEELDAVVDGLQPLSSPAVRRTLGQRPMPYRWSCLNRNEDPRRTYETCAVPRFDEAFARTDHAVAGRSLSSGPGKHKRDVWSRESAWSRLFPSATATAS
jgi:hypothetical protein